MTYLPLMAERFARQRLTALAKVEGLAAEGLPVVLSLCVHNAGRSQMALGWFDRLAEGRAVAWSGGSEPGKDVNQAAVWPWPRWASTSPRRAPEALDRRDRRGGRRRGDDGCDNACPLFPGKRYEDWVLDVPAGQDLEAVRPIRAEIERRVRNLLATLAVPGAR